MYHGSAIIKDRKIYVGKSAFISRAQAVQRRITAFERAGTTLHNTLVIIEDDGYKHEVIRPFPNANVVTPTIPITPPTPPALMDVVPWQQSGVFYSNSYGQGDWLFIKIVTNEPEDPPPPITGTGITVVELYNDSSIYFTGASEHLRYYRVCLIHIDEEDAVIDPFVDDGSLQNTKIINASATNPAEYFEQVYDQTNDHEVYDIDVPFVTEEFAQVVVYHIDFNSYDPQQPLWGDLPSGLATATAQNGIHFQSEQVGYTTFAVWAIVMNRIE